MELTQKDIDADAVRRMREEFGLSQPAFWGPVGVQQSVSSRYEHGHAKIPLPVRILIVARYVGKVKIDASTLDGVKELIRLGRIQAGDKDAKGAFVGVKQELDKSIRKLNAVRDALPSI